MSRLYSSHAAYINV